MDGIGWFTWETMSRLARRHPDHQFIFFFDRKPDPVFVLPNNVVQVVIPPITRLPFLLEWWHQRAIPMAIKKYKPDVYISPDCFLPEKPAVPSIVAIHDLNFEHFPEFMPKAYRAIYHTRVKAAAHAATRIATVSEFSKRDIISTYNIDSDKIDVVYSGLNSFITPLTEIEINTIRQKFNTGPRYFLVSGTIHPRKNPDNIIEAFIRFRNEHPEPFTLVFAGNAKKRIVNDLKKKFRDTPYLADILFTGRVENQEMNGLFRGASALIFTSLYEGFGLPLLEAGAAGIPSITSAATSLAEIGGQSSLLVDPLRPEQIADGMLSLIRKPDLARQLVEKSSFLPQTYTWDRTSDLLWSGVEKAMNL